MRENEGLLAKFRFPPTNQATDGRSAFDQTATGESGHRKSHNSSWGRARLWQQRKGGWDRPPLVGWTPSSGMVRAERVHGIQLEELVYLLARLAVSRPSLRLRTSTCCLATKTSTNGAAVAVASSLLTLTRLIVGGL